MTDYVQQLFAVSNNKGSFSVKYSAGAKPGTTACEASVEVNNCVHNGGMFLSLNVQLIETEGRCSLDATFFNGALLSASRSDSPVHFSSRGPSRSSSRSSLFSAIEEEDEEERSPPNFPSRVASPSQPRVRSASAASRGSIDLLQPIAE